MTPFAVMRKLFFTPIYPILIHGIETCGDSSVTQLNRLTNNLNKSVTINGKEFTRRVSQTVKTQYSRPWNISYVSPTAEATNARVISADSRIYADVRMLADEQVYGYRRERR